MRKASIVLAITACAASSVALAQQREPPSKQASPAAIVTHAGADDTAVRGKSGFGQIMSVLTGLLQDAAGKESVGASSTGARTLSSDESAVTITVTPVAGRSTFFVDKPSVRKLGRDLPGRGNTPPAQVIETATDTPSVALQARAGTPD